MDVIYNKDPFSMYIFSWFHTIKSDYYQVKIMMTQLKWNLRLKENFNLHVTIRENDTQDLHRNWCKNVLKFTEQTRINRLK